MFNKALISQIEIYFILISYLKLYIDKGFYLEALKTTYYGKSHKQHSDELYSCSK